MTDGKKEGKRRGAGCWLYCVVVVSLSLCHKEELCAVAGVVCWVEAGRSAVQAGSMKPTASASLHIN